MQTSLKARYFKKLLIRKNEEYVAQIVITDIESLNDQDTFKIIDINDETNDEHDVDDDDTCYNEMAWNVVEEIIVVCF